MSFIDACGTDELGTLPLPVTVGEIDLAIVRVDDEIFAITDQCSHGHVPLSEGDVAGTTIECYLHGATFDLRTGKPLCLPATEVVPVYPTQVIDGRVLVDLDNPINPEAAGPANADTHEN